MAQPPPDQNFYHPHAHPQLQLSPQFRNPFELIFDERTGAINYNYLRPFIPKPDDLSDSLVMRRPRRTRTTFTPLQVAELEEHFLQSRYLTPFRLAQISAQLALGTAQVKIWFKNRRRRQKIQSGQQKELLCEGMPLSTVSNSVKSESNGSTSSCSSKSSGSSSSGGQTNMQPMSLNGGTESTPNATTPSPTTTTPTPNLVEHYGEPAFNSYYYNNPHVSHPSHCHQQTHPGSLTLPYAPVSTQYYPPGSIQHHPEQYHSAHRHQFQIQHKPQVTSTKEDSNYNFNNPYYIQMSSLTPNSPTTAIQPTIEMSANPKVYEPITHKNNENSNVCNRVASGSSDSVAQSNETKIKLQVLVTNSTNSNNGTFGSVNAISNRSSGTPAINTINNCNGEISKVPKMTSNASDPNYQCSMDTLMHTYNNHRKTSTNTQQFATYCFN